jgi:hypothetical protein
MVKANVCTCPLRPESDSQPSKCDLSLCANRDRRTVANGTSNRSPHRRVLQSPANRAERVISRGSKAECRPHDYDSYGQSGKYNFGHYIPHPLMQASHFIVSELLPVIESAHTAGGGYLPQGIVPKKVDRGSAPVPTNVSYAYDSGQFVDMPRMRRCANRRHHAISSDHPVGALQQCAVRSFRYDPNYFNCTIAA